MLSRLGKVLHWGGYAAAALVVIFVVWGCERKPQPKPATTTMLETMLVKGTCKEDHANTGGQYSGFVSIFKVIATGDLRAVGLVTRPMDSVDMIQAVKHPTAYQPPGSIDIDDAAPDAAQDHWTLHGVSQIPITNSDQSDSKPGYASTCELDVVDRNQSPPSPK